MTRPTDYWHREVLDQNILADLDSSLELYDEVLVELARFYSDDSPGATPEFLARQIGHWLVEQKKSNELTGPVYEKTDGREGEELALGYIGVCAFRFNRKQD